MLQLFGRSEALVPYAWCCLALAMNLVGVWSWGGIVRVRRGVVINPEDARNLARSATLVEVDPPELQRALRAYHNAAATIVPFLLVAQLWVALGAGRAPAIAVFALFTALRYAHSITYLRGLQPWRSIAFFAGQAVFGVMVAMVVVELVAG